MPHTIRVSLPGYNALTDTDPNHYALIADDVDGDENILIKEKMRGIENVNNGATDTINHGLGYPPFVLAYARVTGIDVYLYGSSIYNTEYMYTDSTNVYFHNSGGSAIDFRYYIFYDNVD